MNSDLRFPSATYLQSPTEPLFPLGHLLVTPGALALLKKLTHPPLKFLARHWFGDWGDIGEADRQANQDALIDGDRLFSAYDLGTEQRLWIITEADRSSTTLLLPEEY
jgi:hypothetical protein